MAELAHMNTDHLTRSKRAFFADGCLVKWHHSGFGSGDQQAIACHGIAHSTSKTESSAAESEDPAATMGLMSSAMSPNAPEAIRISWLFIQLRLPFSVLISPLWAATIAEKCWSNSADDRLQRRFQTAHPSNQDRNPQLAQPASCPCR